MFIIECKYLWVLDTVSHDLFPVFIHNLEESSLLWDLLHDVFRREDWLQVKPLSLYPLPFIYGFLDMKKVLLPVLKSHYKLIFHLNKGIKHILGIQ